MQTISRAALSLIEHSRKLAFGAVAELALENFAEDTGFTEIGRLQQFWTKADIRNEATGQPEIQILVFDHGNVGSLLQSPDFGGVVFNGTRYEKSRPVSRQPGNPDVWEIRCQPIESAVIATAGPPLYSTTSPLPPTLAGDGFVYTQLTPARQWIINHNLGFQPAIELFDSAGQEIDAEVIHTSVNQAIAYFTVPVAGRARCT